QWVFCSSKIWNSENVELYYPAPLHIDSGVRILLEMNNPKDPNLKITAALNDLNRGKIVVLGDAEILWNMTEPIGNNAENNKDFLLKLFVYLSGIENSNTSYLPDSGKQNYISSIIHKYKYQVINSENDFNNKNISKKVLIDASAYGLVPDNSPGGLDYFAEFLKMEGYSIEIALDTVADYSEYDLVVNAVSLDKSSINSEIINSKRILLAADGQTDIMNDTMLQLILRGYFSVRYNPELHISPMNIIASFYNIKFPDYTIVSDEKNRFFINGTIKKTGEKFGLKRSGVITGKNNRLPYDFINIAAAEKNYILINNFTPMQTGKKSGNSFFENAIISDPPELTVMAASEKVFAISDFDLLTNQFFYTADGQKVFAAVMDWLNNPEKYKHNWFQKIFGM
ncbi:hypothetical protein KA977_12905, partial [Candidatus Dependentiae bacterium]|nr:hypothetical protein [Candidatus Dependentiae bacterium]